MLKDTDASPDKPLPNLPQVYTVRLAPGGAIGQNVCDSHADGGRALLRLSPVLQVNNEVQVAFFAFMLRVLAGYPAHLRDPKGDILSIADIFDVPAFTAAKGSAPVVREFFQGAPRPSAAAVLHGPPFPA